MSVPAKVGLGMFFFISGYLIPLSLSNTDLKTFIIRRLFRIYPILLFSLSLGILMYNLFGYARWNHPNDFHLGQLISQSLLIRDFTKVGSILSAEWSLLVEIKFYIIAALACFICKRKNMKDMNIYVMIIITILLGMIGYVINEDVGHNFFLVFSILPGSIFYFFKIKNLDIKKGILLAAIVLFIIFITFFENGSITNENFHCYIGYLTGYIFCIIAIQKFKFKRESKIIGFIANISYPIYLTHLSFCLPGFFGLFYNYEHLNNYILILDRFLLLFTVFVPISYLAHKFIEQPCINYSKLLKSSQKNII